MIETLDDCVGRIMAKLDALNLSERTVLIFTSDNGGLHVLESAESPATHNSPYRAGKGFIYEGGLRVPLIVRWPGRVAPGSLSRVPVISTDWVPTWLEIAGVPAKDSFDGVSLVPLLTGGGIADRDLYWHFPHYSNQGGRPAGAIRSGDWKLIEHHEDGRTELFNLARDPGESTDALAEEPDRAAGLRGQLAAWRQAVEAQENAPNPRFDPELARELYQAVNAADLDITETAAEMREELRPWRDTMNTVIKRNLISTDARPVIVLAARAAEIHGSTLRYEAAPQQDVLANWTTGDEWAGWNVEDAPAGDYDVELLYGCAKGEGGSGLAVQIGGETIAATVQDTGHPGNLVPHAIGRVKLAGGSLMLTVKPLKKAAAAVMSLRQVTLVPWSEPPAKPGAPPPDGQ